jgi:uncharacterized membrane protein (Fun14 family)
MGSTKALADANWGSIAQVTLTTLGIAAIAGGFQGWALRRATMAERAMLIVAVLAMQRFIPAPAVALAKDA